MRIDRIEVSKLKVPYIEPLKVAIGEVHGAQNLIIKLITDTGIEGWGECSPNAQVTGDTLLSSFSAASELGRIILGKSPLEIDARTRELRRFTVGFQQLRAAFDMALHDVAAQHAGMPLYQFLGGEYRSLRSDRTIGLLDEVTETKDRARRIVDAGFDAIKLKTGRSGLEDVAHVAAVREVIGPSARLKIDCNQGWDYPTAVANLNAMEPFELEYVEQPLKLWDTVGARKLRQTLEIPVCADESVMTEHDALRLVNDDAVDIINIKLGKSAGLHSARKINAVAEAGGFKCMIGCFAESRLALTAAAHLAVASPNITFIDLDSAYGFREDPVMDGARILFSEGGNIQVPQTPGIGASIAEEFLTETIYLNR